MHSVTSIAMKPPEPARFMSGTRLTADMCKQVASLGLLRADLVDGVQHTLSLIRWRFSALRSYRRKKVGLLKDINGTFVQL